MKNNLLHVVVYEEDKKVLFDGEAVSLTSTNEKGIFDVLPQHGNLIAAINGYLVIRLARGGEQRLTIGKGLLKVEADKVLVFA